MTKVLWLPPCFHSLNCLGDLILVEVAINRGRELLFCGSGFERPKMAVESFLEGVQPAKGNFLVFLRVSL